MKKVYNVRIECNAPTFVMTDEEFCKGLEEVMSDEFGEEMKYVKLKAEPCDKEQQIAIYRRALELAVREIVYDCGSWKLTIEDEMQDYLDQAKKELEEQDVTNN